MYLTNEPVDHTNQITPIVYSFMQHLCCNWPDMHLLSLLLYLALIKYESVDSTHLWQKFRIAINISKLALSVIYALATLRHALGTTYVSSAITNVYILYYGSSEWLQ
jgi:hypothetical protein